MIDHRTVIQRFYDEIWNKLDKDRIPELCHPDFTFRGSLGPTKRGHAGFADYVDFVAGALGDYRCDIQETICEGDKAFARVLFSGIHRGEFLGYPPTQERVEWIGAAVFTFAGGKIADLWVLGDVHALTQQLARDRARTINADRHLSTRSGQS